MLFLRLATGLFAVPGSCCPFFRQPPTPPTAQARKATAAPTLDGTLDDSAWQGVPVIGGFKQREPEEGADVSESTSVRVVYDQANLYIGAELRDSAPAEIRASELRRDTSFTFATAFHSGDRIELVPSDSYERVVRLFPIGPGTVLGPGEYDWRALTLNVRSYNGRTVSSNASVSVGSFYDGDKTTLTLSGDVRPNKMLSVNPSYQINDVHLLAGGFVTYLLGLRANVSFSTNLLTSVDVQYNSGGVFDGKANKSLVLKARVLRPSVLENIVDEGASGPRLDDRLTPR